MPENEHKVYYLAEITTTRPEQQLDKLDEVMARELYHSHGQRARVWRLLMQQPNNREFVRGIVVEPEIDNGYDLTEAERAPLQELVKKQQSQVTTIYVSKPDLNELNEGLSQQYQDVKVWVGDWPVGTYVGVCPVHGPRAWWSEAPRMLGECGWVSDQTQPPCFLALSLVISAPTSTSE